MISQFIELFQNGLGYQNEDRRKKQWHKEIKTKDGTLNESVFI